MNGNAVTGSVTIEQGQVGLSGDASVSGGITLKAGATIAITGRLTNTSPVNVKLSDGGTFTNGWPTFMGSASPAGYFANASDSPYNSGYSVALDAASGEAALVQEKPSAPTPPTADDVAATDSQITISPTTAGVQYIVVKAAEGSAPTVSEAAWSSNGKTATDSGTLTFFKDADGAPLAGETGYQVLVRIPPDAENSIPASDSVPGPSVTTAIAAPEAVFASNVTPG